MSVEDLVDLLNEAWAEADGSSGALSVEGLLWLIALEMRVAREMRDD